MDKSVCSLAKVSIDDKFLVDTFFLLVVPVPVAMAVTDAVGDVGLKVEELIEEGAWMRFQEWSQCAMSKA